MRHFEELYEQQDVPKRIRDQVFAKLRGMSFHDRSDELRCAKDDAEDAARNRGNSLLDIERYLEDLAFEIECQADDLATKQKKVEALVKLLPKKRLVK